MLVVVDQVIILSFLIMIGYYAQKKGYINPTVNQGLADLLINITMPFILYMLMIVKKYSSVLENNMFYLIS